MIIRLIHSSVGFQGRAGCAQTHQQARTQAKQSDIKQASKGSAAQSQLKLSYGEREGQAQEAGELSEGRHVSIALEDPASTMCGVQRPKAPGAGVEKTLRHTERNEGKLERRINKKAAVRHRLWQLCPQAAGRAAEPLHVQGGEDDLDALLAKFKLEDERQSQVQVHELERPPPPRLFATFTPVPAGQV